MVGVVIALAVIVPIVFFFWWAARAGGKMMAEEAARLASSSPATATIKEVHRRGIHQSSRHVVRIVMQVKPVGREPYDATVCWWLDVIVMPRVQPGLDVAVKIDATDPSRVYPDDKLWTQSEASYAAM